MIVKALVDDSRNVDIREVEQRNGATLIEVRVAPEDMLDRAIQFADAWTTPSSGETSRLC